MKLLDLFKKLQNCNILVVGKYIDIFAKWFQHYNKLFDQTLKVCYMNSISITHILYIDDDKTSELINIVSNEKTKCENFYLLNDQLAEALLFVENKPNAKIIVNNSKIIVNESIEYNYSDIVESLAIKFD